LHPGSGGTVGFNKYDLDNTLRLFFYPAVIGWILFFTWISILRYRFETIKNIQIEREDNE
jgi:heme exporter protein C